MKITNKYFFYITFLLIGMSYMLYSAYNSYAQIEHISGVKELDNKIYYNSYKVGSNTHIIGNVSATIYGNIYIENVENVTIENVRIIIEPSGTIYAILIKNSKNILLDNISIIGSYIYIVNSTNITIKDSEVSNTIGPGIYILYSTGINVFNIKFINIKYNIVEICKSSNVVVGYEVNNSAEKIVVCDRIKDITGKIYKKDDIMIFKNDSSIGAGSGNAEKTSALVVSKPITTDSVNTILKSSEVDEVGFEGDGGGSGYSYIAYIVAVAIIMVYILRIRKDRGVT